MDSDSDAPSSEEAGTNTTADDEAPAAFSVSTTGPFVADSDVNHINHQFDAKDVGEVKVAGNDLKVIVEPVTE